MLETTGKYGMMVRHHIRKGTEMWYGELRETIPIWLETLKDEETGLYRLSHSAFDKYSVDATSLAMDVKWMLDLPICQCEWDYLARCQHCDGLIEEEREPDSSEPRAREMSATYLGFQVAGLALATGVKSLYPFSFYDKFLGDKLIEDYLESMPWDTKPMGAGNMIDHGVMMMRYNVLLGQQEYRPIISNMWRWLRNQTHFAMGLWGNPDAQGLNGLVQAGYHIIRVGFPLRYLNSKEVIDTILQSWSESFLTDACFDLDHACLLERVESLNPNYRKFDIWKMAHDMLESIKDCNLRDDGAFSFNNFQAIKNHNRYEVTPGNTESDLVGTVLYMEAIYRLCLLLRQAPPWRSSATHGIKEDGG